MFFGKKIKKLEARLAKMDLELQIAREGYYKIISVYDDKGSITHYDLIIRFVEQRYNHHVGYHEGACIKEYKKQFKTFNEALAFKKNNDFDTGYGQLHVFESNGWLKD